MNILLIYKGRYHVRETMGLAYLSAISKQQGHKVGLFYDSDVFGATDNVFHYQPEIDLN